MAPEEQPPQTTERIVTRNGWIGCSLVALLMTFGNAKNHINGGIAEFVESFIGSLAVVVVIWVLFRWITQKRPIAK